MTEPTKTDEATEARLAHRVRAKEIADKRRAETFRRIQASKIMRAARDEARVKETERVQGFQKQMRAEMYERMGKKPPS